MKRCNTVCLLSVLALGMLSTSGLAQDDVTVLRLKSEAVVVDVVVKAKNGRPVTDLTPEDFQVFEDGVEQQVISFRFQGSQAASVEGRRVAAREAEPDVPQPTEPSAIDPFRQLNLVTLVFDQLSLDGRRLSRQGALDFVKTQRSSNTLVAVFSIDYRLRVVQQFTNDPALLEAAIDVATSGENARFFADRSETIRQGLQEIISLSASAEGMESEIGRGSPPSPALGSTLADLALAQVTVDALQRADEMAREQRAIASVYGLLGLVGEQRALAGRKTLIYFSEGLMIPSNRVNQLRHMISSSNQANVSIYAVDARGLFSSSRMGVSGNMLSSAASLTAGQVMSGGGRAITRGEVMAAEYGETSIRMDTQGTLQDLAESTGGFLIANSNNIKDRLRDVGQDLASYYELAYTPKSMNYDGGFRRVEVKVNRKGLSVQSRNGYFAMPPGTEDEMSVEPFEVPLLAALSSKPDPSDFSFRVRPLKFDTTEKQRHYVLAVEVPLESMTFETSEDHDFYSARFGIMTLVKNDRGEVVRKISQDYPVIGPAGKIDELKKSDVILMRDLELEPGHYRLETAVYDKASNQRSVKRSILVVPEENAGVDLSSLSVVRRVDTGKDKSAIGAGPFVTSIGKVIPDLSGVVAPGSKQEVSIYLVVYTPPELKEKPELILQFVQNGTVIAESRPELPAADKTGRIQFLASFPLDSFEKGLYEVRGYAVQADSADRGHVFFEIN